MLYRSGDRSDDKRSHQYADPQAREDPQESPRPVLAKVWSPDLARCNQVPRDCEESIHPHLTQQPLNGQIVNRMSAEWEGVGKDHAKARMSRQTFKALRRGS